MQLPSSADEFVEIVAWHLEQACRLSREVVRSPIEPPLLDAAGALSHAAREPSSAKAFARRTATTRARSRCSAASTR